MLALQLTPPQLRGRDPGSFGPDRAGANPILRRMLKLEQAGQRELQRLSGVLAPLPAGLEIPRRCRSVAGPFTTPPMPARRDFPPVHVSS